MSVLKCCLELLYRTAWMYIVWGEGECQWIKWHRNGLGPQITQGCSYSCERRCEDPREEGRGEDCCLENVIISAIPFFLNSLFSLFRLSTSSRRMEWIWAFRFWIMLSQASVETGKTAQWVTQLERLWSTEPLTAQGWHLHTLCIRGPSLALTKIQSLVFGYTETSN